MRVGITGGILFRLGENAIFQVKHNCYMRYLLTIMIISALSCKKDSEQPKPKADPPTVIKVETSSQLVDTVARPKFTITLNIPDSDAVNELMIYVYSTFPYSKPVEIFKPKTGVYTVIDMNNTYPPKNKKYFSIFAMKDFSSITNPTFDVN
jgi:hypothetical protein